MLILTRRIGEKIRIGDDVSVTVIEVNGNMCVSGSGRLNRYRFTARRCFAELRNRITSRSCAKILIFRRYLLSKSLPGHRYAFPPYPTRYAGSGKSTMLLRADMVHVARDFMGRPLPGGW